MKGRPYGLAALLGLVCLALAAAVVMQVASALHLANPDPNEQVDRAGDALALAVSGPQFDTAEEQARNALSRAPLEASAVSLLGLAEAQQDRADRAAAFMAAAHALSRRDATADLWLFDNALHARRYATAVMHADALLRRDENLYRSVMVALVRAASDPALIQPLGARLALSPSWRGTFFSIAIRRPLPNFIYPLFETMRTAGGAPTQEEMEDFLTGLTDDGDYERAYLFWMLSLTPADLANLGYVYNGDFEARTTLAPFGWKLVSNEAGMARIVPSPMGGHALEIDSDGYAPGVLANQLLVLPPGLYRFSGKQRTSSDDAPDALRWTLSCANGQQLAEIPAGSPNPDWTNFSTEFAVPPEECAGQRLELKARAGERHGGLTVWYDDLNIIPVRAEEAP